MITGFNTDINYQGVTYHVQTEDKGVATPLILSLVYNRGTILASKRSPYNDLLTDAFDEKILIERLQKQHKLICAAVRAGRIEDLKRMTMKDSANAKQNGLIAQKEITTAEKPTEKSKKPEEIPMPQLLKEKISFVNSPPEITLELTPAKSRENIAAEIPKQKVETVWDIPISIVEEQIIEAVQIVEEEIILPAEAVEIITDAAKNEQIAGNALKIELPEEITFKGGDRKTVTIRVFRGNLKKSPNGANIIVKVIGTSFRPLIFHAKTDAQGTATVHLQLPHFKAGRAAILVRAMDAGEETELRRVIQPG